MVGILCGGFALALPSLLQTGSPNDAVAHPLVLSHVSFTHIRDRSTKRRSGWVMLRYERCRAWRGSCCISVQVAAVFLARRGLGSPRNWAHHAALCASLCNVQTYPVIASIGVAVGWCAFMSTTFLTSSPDVQYVAGFCGSR